MSTLDDDLKRVQLQREQLALKDELAKRARNALLASATVAAGSKAVSLGTGAAKATGRGAWWLAAHCGKIFFTWLVLWALMVWANTQGIGGGVGPRIDNYGQPAAQLTVPAYFIILLIRRFDRSLLLAGIGAFAALCSLILIVGYLLR